MPARRAFDISIFCYLIIRSDYRELAVGESARVLHGDRDTAKSTRKVKIPASISCELFFTSIKPYFKKELKKHAVR